VADTGQGGSNLLPFVLTGRSRERLGESARELRLRLERGACELDRVLSLLVERAAPLPCRAVVLARSREDLLAKLDKLEAGASPPGVIEGRARAPARVAFVFSPLRSEYRGMGLDLLASHNAFQLHMQAWDTHLSRLTDWSLEDVLRDDPGAPPLARLDVSQPLLVATTASLAELWGSFGVKPDAVAGHSVGEIAAAASCGALPIEDAVRVAVTWGRSSRRLEGAGAMASLPLSAEAVEERIVRRRGPLSIAALNAPSWTAVSGQGKAIEELLEELAEEGIHGRSMSIPAPGHSPGMAPIHEWFTEALAGISPRPSATPFYSTVSGDRLASTNLDAGYWSSNLRQPVLFEPAIRALLRDEYDVFIEIGPRPVLTAALKEIVGDRDALVIGTLEQGDPDAFLVSLARAYVRGAEVDWGRACGDALPARPRSSRAPISLEGVPARQREQVVLDLVLGEVAAAREYDSPAAVDRNRPFKDLGFDSAAAVDLRNALNRLTGLALPVTLAFDHPTPNEVARKLRLELEGEVVTKAPAEAPSAIDELDAASLVELVLEDEGQPGRD
jgi:acyl transferase domain-containing protein